MLKIIAAESPQEIRQVQALFREILAFNTELLNDMDLSTVPVFESFDEEMQNLPGEYAPPRGRLKLALVDGQPAGCVALLPLDEYTCELKRMWVSSGFRGQKVGWSLTEHLIAKARAMGYTKMELSTHIALRQAQRIYLGQGFEIVDAPEDAPPIMKELAVFMSLDLT